jgi:hypothetical protein
MRVQFAMEGGISYFPGLSQPVVIDSATLPPEEADELQQLDNATRFFTLPTSIGTPPPGAADYRQYTVSIEDGDRAHAIQLHDPIEDSELEKLIRFLQTKAGIYEEAGVDGVFCGDGRHCPTYLCRFSISYPHTFLAQIIDQEVFAEGL